MFSFTSLRCKRRGWIRWKEINTSRLKWARMTALAEPRQSTFVRCREREGSAGRGRNAPRLRLLDRPGPEKDVEKASFDSITVGIHTGEMRKFWRYTPSSS